jgi:hypothetical protein
VKKTSLRNISLVAVMVLVCFITSCSAASQGTQSALTPLAETRDNWSPELVVAIFERGGENFYSYFSPPPDVVIYSDGRQVLWHEGYLYERYLSNKELCTLLTEIEDSGFFDYTSQQYKQFYESNQLKQAPENFSMTINAWKSNTLQLSSFPFLYSQHKGEIEWPAALSVPYERLTEYDPKSMHLYIPDRIAVHIVEDPQLGTEVETSVWKSTTPSLSELIERYDEMATPASESSEGEIILVGEESKSVLEQFDNNPWSGPSIFEINGTSYLVAIRALLPYEESGGVSNPLIPGPNAETMPISINCP